jgi:hypothetical protein
MRRQKVGDWIYFANTLSLYYFTQTKCIYLDLFPYYTSQEECLEIFNQTMLLGALIKALAYLQNFVSHPEIVIIFKQTSRC